MKRLHNRSRRRTATQRRRITHVRYTQLLKLAPGMKPPQSWYDEALDPFTPERKSE